MKYAHYEKTSGKLLGWYDDNIHTEIPTPNIEVSEEDWKIAISNGYNFVDANNTTVSKKDLRPLDQVKIDQKRLVKESYFNELKNGFTCSNNIKMDAEIDKAQMLKNGYDLAVSLGQSTMSIRDFDNIVHQDLNISDIDAMLQELGINFQTQLGKKWVLEKTITEAATVAEVLVVKW